MDEKIKEMIRMAAEDGVITEKEKALIIKKAKDLGEDLDMVELAIEGELGQLKKDADKKVSKGEKCPNCGSVILPGSAVCLSCGFALVSKKTNDTALVLQKDLLEIGKGKRSRNKIASRIYNTVVPNNREDLLNLLAFTAPKANRLGPREYEKGEADDFSYAYWQLFENCILMAKNSFMDDASFLPFYQKHEEMTKKKPFEWYRKLSGSSKEGIQTAIWIGLGVILLFVSMILAQAFE